ncbi:glycosyltransferase family protein [Paenibacillus chungangensis]|uniref:Glycosyltransferase n=1 Tax=Paenibacillus chungangensis TaxID=696535 RepID=A0ABW3HLD7_9BACL
MKVLHLPYGIGMSALSLALRGQGIDATSCSLKEHHYDYMADIRIRFDRASAYKNDQTRQAFFMACLDQYDIFHFHFGETFLPDKSDLNILKQHGKKMVMHHRGSEVRLLTKAQSFNNPYVRVKPSWPEHKIKKNLKLLSTYIDHAIVADHELLPYVEPYYKHVHVVPYAIDAGQYKLNYPSADSIPLIVHAPSNQDIKGTRHVIQAVERLRGEHVPFIFKLIHKIPHTEAIQLYEQATIIVDQLLIGTYANLSMEAMSMGKPVICYVREDLRSKFPPSLPIVSATPDTIYAVLKDLIATPNRWAPLGIQGRQYVEQQHSMEKVAKSLIQIYRRL